MSDTVEVPREELELVLERAEMDAQSLSQNPDVDEETVDEVEAAIEVVDDAIER
ncbi:MULTISPECIES: hypothetical protein [Haloarculaceae]|uniref:hypothetical protein n=1 Tax=Halobacteriales TaxID=2235 RepID=UPI0012982A49|nr:MULTISPECIES: hypothetical protein [Haloarculaceae]QGA82012.1 hypothetical protein LC1Hm_0950 [Halomicrobium sp. LC1Hm]